MRLQYRVSLIASGLGGLSPFLTRSIMFIPALGVVIFHKWDPVKIRYIRHAKEYTSLGRLEFCPLLSGESGNSSGAAQASVPIFTSLYVADNSVKPPNMMERPKSVSTALSSSSIRTLNGVRSP